MRPSMLVLLMFAVGLGVGATVAAVLGSPSDERLEAEQERRAEASRQADLDEAQQSQLEKENRELEAEIEAALEWIDKTSPEREPKKLWQDYEEMQRDVQALRRVVRRLATWSHEAFETWPPTIRNRREYGAALRELLTDSSEEAREMGWDE